MTPYDDKTYFTGWNCTIFAALRQNGYEFLERELLFLRHFITA